MPTLHEGARQLPLRHLSIRVPWNDTDWTGVVCQRPADNIACLILPRISENRDDQQEALLAGQSWEELSPDQLPPCFTERGGFMAPYELTRMASHPYAAFSKAHRHFLPTPFRHPPYSAACLPFNWTLAEPAVDRAARLDLGFVPELEKKAHDLMNFETAWVQTKHNQLVMLDTFFSAIQPERSLCFFYAKRTPLAEDARRVIIGVGWVTHVGAPVEYRYSGPGELEGMLWERAVQHSIRPGFEEGFLFPYQEVLEYLEQHPEEDPHQLLAFVPDEHFWSFSYASEHVTNDGAIGSLLSCARALEQIQGIVPGPWEQAMSWVDERLNELWGMRGPCPGLGSALTAFGLEKGTLVAYELERILAQRQRAGNEDPWILVDTLFREPGSLHPELHVKIGDSLRKKWLALAGERRALLKLLSRFELTTDQATRYYVHEDQQRIKLGIAITDPQLLANPYLFYELDRVAPDPISLATIDRGLFPDPVVRNAHPLPDPMRVDDATDVRRVRAFVVRQLEQAAVEGDTLHPRTQVIQEIRGLDVQPACPVDGDLMSILEASFPPTVHVVDLTADEQVAYQLERLHRVGRVIRRSLQRRMKGKRHEGDIPWHERLAEVFGEVPADDQEEQDARIEKTAALQELFASRLSVLIGPAGTGKTTLLRVLCHEPQVEQGGILLLAPTGKARVRMEKQIEIRGAQTIAQFLLPLGRYDPDTGAYRLSDRERLDVGRTVIIDEASMLTEEQLAAVLDALKKIDRLILVGDPRQLPPIGAGRPFLDIVRYLTPSNTGSLFPRVGPGYAELTVRRRQMQEGAEERDDLLLAEWFSGRPLDAGADEIWTRIEAGQASRYLSFVRWDTSDELQTKLLDLLVAELQLTGLDDSTGFEQSLGGVLYKGNVYFQVGRNGEAGACAKVEDWQILSPVRAKPYGVEALNRLIQTTFRSKAKDFAARPYRKIPKPMGREGILYGDKVINTQNMWRADVWPKDGALRYVANGEIGIVVGQFKGRNAKYKRLPWKLEVEFSSQPAFKYGYSGKSFAEESAPVLELAYCLTIHKTQGSEFRRTFVVLPNPCRLLSRELLYTALTRQQDGVVVLHQGDCHDLKRYSEDYYSEAASRLTNLFGPPRPVELQDRFLEGGLIHKTRRGDSVRSKSEVIIADLLYSKNIEYHYELRLVGQDGTVRYPDFTIEDDETGQIIYWEHLGMMRNPTYRRRWQSKLAWYRTQGILPWEEGGGRHGILLITRDDERGGIDVKAIERLIEEILG